MSYSNLAQFYKVQWGMKKHHGYSITELEEMYPFERDIHVELTAQWIEKENNKSKE